MTLRQNNTRTPLGQLQNTAPLQADKLLFAQDNFSKQTLNYGTQENPIGNMLSSNVKKPSLAEQQEESEYAKVLRKALQEALDENTTVIIFHSFNILFEIKLSARVTELEALVSAAQDENELKDKAILELADILEVSLRQNFV